MMQFVTAILLSLIMVGSKENEKEYRTMSMIATWDLKNVVS